MNERGLTNVEGFSQLSRPKLVKLILNNPDYFGLPAVKIVGKKRTYYNYEDKQLDKDFDKWTDYYDPEIVRQKIIEEKRKKEERKIQKEKGIPDVGVWDKLFKISPEEQKRFEKEEMMRKKVKELDFSILSTQKEMEDLEKEVDKIDNLISMNESFNSKKALEKGKEKNIELKKDLDKIKKDLFKLKDKENKLREERQKIKL
jgi:hypothetical protein